MTSNCPPFQRILIRAVRLLLQPGRLVLAVMRRLNLGSHELRCALDLYPRPHYAYGVQQAADLARRLGMQRISVVEFGVAGGAGLVELTRMARKASAATGVRIEVYGFDRADGLPKPVDYRDLPYIWREGDFTMDVAALQRRVPECSLILGDIEDTVESFIDDNQPAPIGFVAIDVDFYSSAAAALRLFRGEHAYFLPRVFCYFDDTVGDQDQVLHNEFVGELRAIAEFNEESTAVQLTTINGLVHKRAIPAPWHDSIYVLHRFEHPEYGQYIADPDTQTQLPL